MRSALSALLCSLLCAGVAAGQTPVGPGQPRQTGGDARTPARAGRVDPQAAGTAALRGQVVAADTGTPIRRAQVRVSAQNVREARVTITDGQGRFEIRDLAAGRYTLTASKGGFVTLQYGQRRPGESGTPLELAEGQALDKLLVGLPRGSVIGGRITDEFGEPLVNAAVSALRYAFVGGARRLVPAGARDTTDDQGSYRLFGLPPGDYLVSATLRAAEVTDPGGDLSGYAPTYFPGTSSLAEAQRVRVALAAENVNVSFGLIATRLVRVSGQVTSATGGPAGGMVTLGPAGGSGEPALFTSGGGATRVDANGTFHMNNVAPGRYTLQARSGPRGDGEFARIDLTVGRDDIEGVTLVMAPAGYLSGAVVTDRGTPLPSSGVQVTARPASPDAAPIGPGAGGGGPAGRVSPEGYFEIGNIIEPRVIRVTAPQGWTLKAVLLNSQDITDVPLDVPPGQHVTGVKVVLTQTASTVTGTVTDARKQPVLDATVVLFPVDPALRGYLSRFIRSARPNQQGTFSITATPPGEYLAVAVQALEDGQAADPEFLASVESLAARVTVEEGESKTVNLELRGR
jgi:Carboxypeptidase regulatory-like domain